LDEVEKRVRKKERKKEKDNAEFAERAEIAEKRNPRAQPLRLRSGQAGIIRKKRGMGRRWLCQGMLADLKIGHYKR